MHTLQALHLAKIPLPGQKHWCSALAAGSVCAAPKEARRTSCAAAMAMPVDLRQTLRVGRAAAAVASLHLATVDRDCIEAVTV